MQYLISNADDFGRSPAINSAIRECFKNGLVSDTSIMVTCKEGVDELLEQGNMDVLNGTAGCHLTLTLGKPLTERVKSIPFIVKDGEFQEFPSKLPRLSSEDKLAIQEEFIAQINYIKNVLGLEITHLDSHQHIHFDLQLLPIVASACRQAGIPYLRIPSRAKNLSFKSKIATWVKMMYIKLNGIKVVDFFGSPNQILSKHPQVYNITELMIHPMYDSHYNIVNKVRVKGADDCENIADTLEPFAKYEKISFKDIL